MSSIIFHVCFVQFTILYICIPIITGNNFDVSVYYYVILVNHCILTGIRYAHFG